MDALTSKRKERWVWYARLISRSSPKPGKRRRVVSSRLTTSLKLLSELQHNLSRFLRQSRWMKIKVKKLTKKKRRIQLDPWNLEILTGKSMESINTMKRRVNLGYLQETKWKVDKAKKLDDRYSSTTQEVPMHIIAGKDLERKKNCRGREIGW